jgi:hypothetical protein
MFGAPHIAGFTLKHFKIRLQIHGSCMVSCRPPGVVLGQDFKNLPIDGVSGAASRPLWSCWLLLPFELGRKLWRNK